MKQRTNNVEVHCFADVVPQYVTLKLYPDFYGVIIAFHISREQFEWLNVHCNDSHIRVITSKGKYYLQADYALSYTIPIEHTMSQAPIIKNNLMVWMRRAKVAILNREINQLQK